VWILDGLLHRWGGPAIIDTQHKQEQYWLNGIPLSEQDYLECLDNDIWPIPWFSDYRLAYVRRSDSSCIHRVNGPAAVRNNGLEEWFVDGRPLEKSEESNDTLTSLALTAIGAVGMISLLKNIGKVKVAVKRPSIEASRKKIHNVHI
jgi:hypothetical protein